MKDLIRAANSLILLTLVLTLLCGLIYVAVQQVLRQSANDPQIQMAEDIADALAEGKAPPSAEATADPSRKIDLAQSLVPFVISFEENLQPISSAAELNHKTPVPPPGVFEFAKVHGEDWFTWQPRRGVRIAAVLVHYSGQKSGFVLAGRSLRETETRVSAIGHLILAGWIGSMLALGITTVALRMIGGSPKAV